MIDLAGSQPRGAEALIQAGGGRLTYGGLADRVRAAADALLLAAGGRTFVVLPLGPSVDAVTLHLACLAAGLPLCPLEPGGTSWPSVLTRYAPGLVLLPEGTPGPEGHQDSGVRVARHVVWRPDRPSTHHLHPELALLLPTSGSTGSPKLVRLSSANVMANARSIAEILPTGPGERAITSLPLPYAYGLSVLHSHLHGGGLVVLTGHSFLRPEFWGVFGEERCTSFAGVPYVYETLHRLRFDPAR